MGLSILSICLSILSILNGQVVNTDEMGDFGETTNLHK